MHVNDTFGTAMSKGIGAVMPKFDMPYTIAEEIAYDPAARDLSVEVAKAKATNADALLVVSRLNDAMLLTRELVKQRWTPQAILSMGPGFYEDQYIKTLGKYPTGRSTSRPGTTRTRSSPRCSKPTGQGHPGVNLNTNHVFTFEALLVAADAYKRAGSTDPKALADAIRTTNITDNVSIGPGIQFDAKGPERQGAGKARFKTAAASLSRGAAEAAKASRNGRCRVSEPQAKLRSSAVRRLSQRRRRRSFDRPCLRPDGAWAVGHFRRGAGRQFRPWRDDDDRDVHRRRVVLRFHLDPLILLVPIAAVMFVFGYVLQIGLINPFISRPEHSQFLLLVALGSSSPTGC